MPSLKLNVNGETYQVEASPEMPLLWVLRDTIGLTGTKYSCGKGLCGSCTVHLDGEAVRSCITPASAAASREITTIEGLSADGDHPLQQAWIEEKVPQCGYCQPGQIMAAAALLAKNPNPGAEQTNAAMAGNLCRCGTYPHVIQAALRAARGA